ncbi:MAG: site-specific DNA-methyltransferase, partial [Verrucomicrobiota bacterium]
MQKLTANDPETKTPDLAAENLAKLKALFPEMVTEDGVNVDVLNQLIGKTVTDTEEKYGLNWHGKRCARQMALTPSTGTLRPCLEDSVDWDKTRNLMIEGDNLEVLKLLQKSYAGKVKRIYIDPPYNTGKDFVYPDNFQDNIKNYLALTGQTGEVGEKLSSNTEASGRFHTDWLNMTYPRLKLARNLLREDGVMFVSIADHEIHNLRSAMDEVFGPENFIATIIWHKMDSPKNTAFHFSEDHDYVLVFAKEAETWRPNGLERTEAMIARYKNPDNDPRGVWLLSDLAARNFYAQGRYPITTKSGKVIPGPPAGSYWRVNRERFDELDKDNRIWWGE